MARPVNKPELLRAAAEKFGELNSFITSMTERELSTTFDFSGIPSKKERHWSRDKNLRDVLIHLNEWHNLVLNWVAANEKGENKPLLPDPYNWRTYGDMPCSPAASADICAIRTRFLPVRQTVVLL